MCNSGVFIFALLFSGMPKVKSQDEHTPYPYSVFSSPLSESRNLQSGPPCSGMCIDYRSTLFCDKIDTEAVCVDGENCCINEVTDSSETNTDEYSTTMTTSPDPMELSFSECPGYCISVVFSSFCEQPSLLLPYTSDCQEGFVCCDNTRVKSSSFSLSEPETSLKPFHQISTTTSTTSTTDDNPECQGLCIAPYLPFVCSGLAEMTDLFHCRIPGTVCCTLKSDLIKYKHKNNGGVTITDNEFKNDSKYSQTHSMITSISTDAKINGCAGKCINKNEAHQCSYIVEAIDVCESDLICCTSKDDKNENFPKEINQRLTTLYTLLSPTITNNNENLTKTACSGKCIKSFETTSCSNVNTNAVCPLEEICCVFTSTDPNITMSQNNKDVISDTTATAIITTVPLSTESVLPKCPGFCIHIIMSSFCQKPSVLIPYGYECQKGLVCCDGTSEKVARNESLPITQNYISNTTTQIIVTDTIPTTSTDATYSTTKQYPKCPGFCILTMMTAFCRQPAILVPHGYDCQKRQGLICCDNTVGKIIGNSTDSRVTLFNIYTNPISLNATPELSIAATTTVSTATEEHTRCSGNCVSAASATSCKLPSVLLSHTLDCPRDFLCCENRIADPTLSQNFSALDVHDLKTSVPFSYSDNRPYCPGSCIVSHLSYHCSGDNQLTDYFSCSEPQIHCCASTISIKEYEEQSNGIIEDQLK